MKVANRSQATRKAANVLAVNFGLPIQVLATGRSISEALSKASSLPKAKKEPAILFVPRRNAIHVF